jgi:hypothetical protein
MLFGEMVADNSEHETKPINTVCGKSVELLIDKGRSCHWVF